MNVFMQDVEELQYLALVVMGMDENSALDIMNGNHDGNAESGDDWEAALEKKYGCNFHQFCELVEMLLPMTPLAQSPLTGKTYHAFMGKDGCAVIKMENDNGKVY